MINNLQLCPNKNSHIVNNIPLKFYLKLILINYLLLMRIQKKLFFEEINTMKYFYLSFITSKILYSCKVVHSTKFEIDNSGKAAVYIDMSQFVKKMGEIPKKAEKDVNFAEKKNARLDSIALIEYLSQI